MSDDWPATMPHHGARAHASWAEQQECGAEHCVSCGGCLEGQEGWLWDFYGVTCDDCRRWLWKERLAQREGGAA